MTAATDIVRLWPAASAVDGCARPLDDDALAAAYPVPAARDAGRAWLRANFVAGLDGAVTTVDGRCGGLSSPNDQRLLHLLRALCDGLMVGAGTLRAEGYGALVLDPAHRRRRTRAGLAPHPVLVVVSGRLDLDPAHPMFAEAPVRPVVVTHAAAPAGRRRALAGAADVLVCGDDAVDLGLALRRLSEHGLPRLLCEGGPTLFGGLVGAGLVDELCLTLSPLLVGPGPDRLSAGPAAAAAPRGMRLAHLLTDGEALFARYLRG
ncbi:MAG TPA: pyrimidine reductase family protein [Pilimelia sp.]|nr:pyrimidine reductase family protein [Pilimelia sp.]